MRIRLAIMITAFLGGLSASPAEAQMCGPDFWGSRSSWITSVEPLTAQIHATTNVVHGANHTGCSGQFSAKVDIDGEAETGGAAACSSGTISKTHQSDGTNTSVPVVQNCAFLKTSTAYSALGTHAGFGEVPHYSQSHHIGWWKADGDGDGAFYDCFGEEGCEEDCDDTDQDAYPGASAPWCGSPEGEWDTTDYNCNGTPDSEEDGGGCPNSPILIDVTGNGFQLTNRENGVQFDLNNNGSPEQLPWTAAGVDDSWLVLDRNGNGTIDDGGELFGNFTLQPASAVRNGYAALAVFDTAAAGGNGNGWIDPADQVFITLGLWRDANHDGVSQPSELINLSVAGVTGISLKYHENRKQDRWGNWFRFFALVTANKNRDVGPLAYDVFLAGKPPKAAGR